MIAMQEGVPLVPCGLDSFGWSRRSRRACCVVYGEPLALDDLPRTGRGYKEGSERLRLELLRLWRQAAEAVGAGFPETLPDGTPRQSWVGPGAIARRDGQIRNVNALS
jgi:hypothetical protein